MHHAFSFNGDDHLLTLSRTTTAYCLHLGDEVYAIDLRNHQDDTATLVIGEQSLEVVIATQGDEVFVHLDGEVYQLRYRHPLERLAASQAGNSEDAIRAPMPGSLVVVAVQAGDAVVRGQLLLVMESMKMETTINAPRDGVVHAITYEKGQTFDRDAMLISLLPLAIEK
jgi:acetyl/propionyl-CoA carboxylase alpha subunit